MKSKLLLITTFVILFFPKANFGQAPTLGTAANFVLFTTVGAVSNVGITHLTGNVGTNSGLSTAFGNVDGQMHDNDLVSAQCVTDLLIAYNQLNITVPTFFPAPLLGNGQILNPGVYSIPTPATLNLTLFLDGLGNPNAVFIFKIQGAFSANALSKIKLINGTKACNVFWKIEGLIDIAAGATMRGTFIANNAAINMNAGDTLEGRALSTNGAVTVSGLLGYTPIGCGSLVLNGPIAPNLGSAECFELFTTNGPVTNVGVTNVKGDIGTNNGTVTGYNPLLVVGAIHGVPDGATAACATDLNTAYLYLNTLPFDIELLYPVQFGNNLVLTPHTYVMNGATAFTDSLYLNAQGNANAIFVIKIYGALTTSTYAKVILMNGALSKNVYWLVDGAVSINSFSIFRGTIICNNGAINLNTGVTLDGRALTTTGALSTSAINAYLPLGTCGSVFPPLIITEPTNQIVCLGSSASFSVAAVGTGLSYQWRKGSINLIDGGSISGATTATLTINPAALVDAAINYNVIVSSSAAPNDTSNNVSLTVNNCTNDIGVIKTVSTISPIFGNTVTFVIIAKNNGSINGTGVVVTDILQSGYTYVSSIATIGTYNNATGIWTIGNLISGASESLTITATVQSSGSYTNTATVVGNEPDGNMLNNSSTVVTYPININNDLSVIKTVNMINPNVGSNVMFIIKAKNNGLLNGTGVVVTDILQSGYTYVSSNATIGSYNNTTGIWTIGNLISGASESLTITATVQSSGSYTNTATVIGNEIDGNLINNSSTVVTYPIEITQNDFNIPQGFSPNGDYINDLFIIRGIDRFPNNNFTIFNRWGDKIFEANPYKNTWDGSCSKGLRMGGDALPTGTYFYVIDLGDGSKIIKGTIYLNR